MGRSRPTGRRPRVRCGRRTRPRFSGCSAAGPKVKTLRWNLLSSRSNIRGGRCSSGGAAFCPPGLVDATVCSRARQGVEALRDQDGFSHRVAASASEWKVGPLVRASAALADRPDPADSMGGGRAAVVRRRRGRGGRGRNSPLENCWGLKLASLPTPPRMRGVG